MAVTKPDLRRTWAAGAPAANVQDPDSVVPGKYNSGWEEEIPPFEFFNFIQQLMTQGLAHLNERGIPEWDADTEYLGGRSYVTGSNGDVYVAVIDNSGNDPVSDGGTNWITLRDYIIDSLTASEVGYDNTLSGLTADNVQAAIDELANTITSERIGVPFPIWDHIPGCPIPDNSGAVKYIKLTAGEDGSGQYNEGLLTSESLTGSAPDIVATAVISYAGSPMNGQTVSLINTERRIVRPGGSGIVQGDAIRNITGAIGTDRAQISNGAGAFDGPDQYAQASIHGSTLNIGRSFTFDASRVVPTAYENRMKNIGATYYMRIA